MALDNSATLNVSNLAVLVANPDTDPPANSLAPAALEAFNFDNPTLTGFTLLGHTSLGTDVTLSATVSGGETLGSLQRAALRRTPITATYAINIALLQLDNQALSLYFGGGDVSVANQFGIPKTFTVAQRSVILVMADSENAVGWHFAKAELQPNGDISFGPSALSEMGLTISILDSDDADVLGTIFRDNLGASA